MVFPSLGSRTRWMISTISGPSSGAVAMVCLGRPQPRSSNSSAARSCAISLVLFSMMEPTLDCRLGVGAGERAYFSNGFICDILHLAWGIPSLFQDAVQHIKFVAHSPDDFGQSVDIVTHLFDRLIGDDAGA